MRTFSHFFGGRSPKKIFSYPLPRGQKSSHSALVSYLTSPLFSKVKPDEVVNFSNTGIALSWPKVVTGIGFHTEVIDWDNTSFEPSKIYDLVVLHGGKNTAKLKPAIGPRTKVIYFASGCYWQFHNAKERERFEYFEKRHGVKLPPDRLILDSEEEANQLADGIICLGNEHTKSTFSKFKNVYNLKVGSYGNSRSAKQPKAIKIGRKNFLFFSGNGNIHKGLDLLLDVFKELPDYNLYICTNLDPEFEKFYYDLLYNATNIHFEGYVPPRSERFGQLVDSCDFVTLPSCSEGSPGSVVDCMQQGLIPIVSLEAGLDTGDFGLTLPKTDLSTLKRAIKEASDKSLEELTKMSAASQLAALEYSPEAFEANLKKYVELIYKGSSK